MVMHRDRQNPLRLGLANDIIVKNLTYFLWCRYVAIFAPRQRTLGFLTDDVIAQLDTFVADEHGWPCDKLTDFVLRFSAE